MQGRTQPTCHILSAARGLQREPDAEARWLLSACQSESWPPYYRPRSGQVACVLAAAAAAQASLSAACWRRAVICPLCCRICKLLH